jgi:formyltetrahydrofolate-dependent phosphoribosylglycinamide formyltransferase
MFEGLQKKWKVSSSRLILILLSFAIGGSLTGYLARKIILLLNISATGVYIPLYIIIITLLWPITVLIVSIPLGQFSFFKNYLQRMGRRLHASRYTLHARDTKPEISNQQQEGDTLHAARHTLATNPKLQTPNPKHLVVFASGAGSNAQKIIDHFRDSSIARVVLVVCNKPGAGVIKIAETEEIDVLMIEKERFFRGDGYVSEFQKIKTDLIVLAGFLWKIPQSVIDAYPRRIINIHPALLPKYGGKGMYGQYVHEAVLNAGEMQSGITIHYVDEHYDNGDVIFQTACPVIDGDTPDELAHRIHELEHAYYPKVVEEVLRAMNDDRELSIVNRES